MAFDISKYAQMKSTPLPGEELSIDEITAEILRLKEDAGNAIIGIGQWLIQAKDRLPHGEWLPWLTEKVEFSERTAQNFMRLAREWSNPQNLRILGSSKALMLLALPPAEREQFMQESHMVDGEEKNVIDMTSNELKKALRERDEARKAAEAARAEAATAEESRAKMEADIAALKALHQGAQETEARTRQELETAQAELRDLREKPVDVAVMEVDQEALEKARQEARAELQAKLDKAVEARKKAEERRKAVEADLELMQKKLDAASAAEKRAALSSDKDFAAFELLFSQAQEHVNKLHGLLLKFKGREDQEMARKLQKALLALADMTRRCAE